MSRLRTFGELEVDPAARVVRVRGRDVALTRVEFDLLDSLSSSPGAVLTRRQLIDRVWGQDWYADEHVVNVHISNLRRKLGVAGRLVLTARGVGYRFGGGD